MANVALADPLNGSLGLAGPELIRQNELVRRFLNATGDARTAITDLQDRCFGLAVDD